jgi:hypothetical protein
VLEINTDTPDRAVRALKAAQDAGELPLDEVALYGAQIHAVVPDAEQYKAAICETLTQAEIVVRDIAWIAPTLEDVFISAVR